MANWYSRSAPLARASSNSILLGVLLQMRDDSFLQDAGQFLLQDDVGMLQVNEGRIRPSCGESAIAITTAIAKSVRNGPFNGLPFMAKRAGVVEPSLKSDLDPAPPG
jgi:hypothetical protein